MELIQYYFYSILLIALIGFCAGCLTRLVLYCIGDPWSSSGVNERAIFSFYGKFIFNRWHKSQSKKYMMLGMCPWCFNVWLTMVVVITCIAVSSTPWWTFFFAMGTSYLGLNLCFHTD